MHRTLAARNAMFWIGAVFASTAANEQRIHSFFKKVRLRQRIGRFISFFS